MGLGTKFRKLKRFVSGDTASDVAESAQTVFDADLTENRTKRERARREDDSKLKELSDSSKKGILNSGSSSKSSSKRAKRASSILSQVDTGNNSILKSLGF